MARGNELLLSYIAGIKLEVSGLENIPQNEGCVIAAKHQSAFETLTLFHKIPSSAYVFKRELGYIPLFGTSNYLVGNVAVNRGGGASAIKSLIKNVKSAVGEGRRVIIFPEGSRMKVGETIPYKPSVYALYKQGIKIVPCALNTGCFWPKKSFMKYAGNAKIQLLPVMPAGLSKEEFNSKLQEIVEVESRNLEPKNL